MCKALIHAEYNYLICFHHSFVFHTSCSPLNNNNMCVHCNQQSSIVPVPMLDNHRNFYHVLIHMELHVKKLPGINYHTNPRLHQNQRYPPRPIQLNQPPHPPYPPLPSPKPPLPPPLPVLSNIHIISISPTTTPNVGSDHQLIITRNV